MTTPISSSGEAPASSPPSDDVRPRAQSAFDLFYTTDPATVWRLIDEAGAQSKAKNHEPLATQLDIMTTPNPYTEIRRVGVYVRTGPASPYDDDVVLGSELAAKERVEDLVQAELAKTMIAQTLAAFLTGFPPQTSGLMSTENRNST